MDAIAQPDRLPATLQRASSALTATGPVSERNARTLKASVDPQGVPNEVRAGQRIDSGQWTVIELRYQCENGPRKGSLFSGLRQIALKGPVKGMYSPRDKKRAKMQLCMEDIGIVYSIYKGG